MKKVLIAILLLGLLPHASADYIHWVDFRLSAPVLRSALELDMASQGGEQPLDWIDILALAAAWRRGTGVTVADTQRAAQILRGDTPPERLPGMAGRCFSYYRAAYGAALGGLVGHFAIRRTDPQTGEAEWIPAYGLKAFSPIAAGYPWSHYPDFGAQRSYGYARPHLGNDILGALGTPICAVEGGTVEALGWNRYGGWRIGIRSDDRKRYYYYAHLRKDTPYAEGLAVGQRVQAGDVIGFMGRTGYSAQENVNNIETVHLHFGLQLIFDESQKECDSEIWIDVYPIIELLASHCSSVARDPQTGRWERLYPYCDLDAEPLRSAAAR